MIELSLATGPSAPSNKRYQRERDGQREGGVSQGGGGVGGGGGRSEDVFLRPTSGCSVPLQPLRLRDEADDSNEEKRKIKESERERPSTCSPGSFLHSGRGRLSHHREERHRQTHLFNSYKSCVCVCVCVCVRERERESAFVHLSVPLCSLVCVYVCVCVCVNQPLGLIGG